MKDNRMTAHTILHRLPLATMALVAATTGLSGCLVISDGGGGHYDYNEPPYFTDLYVNCDYDYYGDGYWDFTAYVRDDEGEASYVWVEVFDHYNYRLEEWDLAWDGAGRWSNRIYEYYSDYLDCYYWDEFEFDFYAVDSHGESASLTYIWDY